ncbi:MAG: choice-of-anchor Q domain-containing protein [Chitinophagales bacterium]
MNKYFRKIQLAAGLTAFIIIIFSSQSCRRDIFITDPDAALKFSEDTVHFDTVFTTVGSVTLPLLIFNEHNDPISIASIELSGGESSQFRMNVDGESGTVFHDIEIPANDSLYVFIEVTVDPNAIALPFVIEDSIIFQTNGNVQDVKLIALGQNAHFHYGEIVCNEEWFDDLPHVIIGSVLVDTLCHLNIHEGCNIYLHGGSFFYVLGTLNVNVEGNKDSVVVFQGDRLEDFYKDVPGQWEGVYFLRGSTGDIKYTEIKNANDGIATGYSTNPDLTSYYDFLPNITISNSKIYNCQNNGIFSLNSKIKATNVLIYNIGLSNAALFLGGDYYFRHCTLANYSSDFLAHQTPSLGIFDWFEFSQTDVFQDDLTRAEFIDCIVYGSLAEGNEIVIDTMDAVTVFDFKFDHCILRTDIHPDLLNDFDCIFNTDPRFTNIGDRNYIPDTLSISPAINAGVLIPSDPVNDDIRGDLRPFPGTDPDIGAYETNVIE